MSVWGPWRMVQRNGLVYRRVWRGTLFTSFLQPTLFLLAIGYGVGELMDAREGALPAGLRYLEFLAPGLLAAAAMQAATFESTYPVLGKMTWRRNYDAIVATPMAVTDIVLGELAWIAVRLTTVGTAFVLVMLAFDIPRTPRVWLAVPAAVLTGLAFAAPICAYAATRKTSGTFNVLYRFGITPLFLFSGVFFPVSRLPAPLDALAWGTPLFHGVELTRGLTLDLLTPRWILHVGVLLALVAGGVVAGRYTFGRQLHA